MVLLVYARRYPAALAILGIALVASILWLSYLDYSRRGVPFDGTSISDQLLEQRLTDVSDGLYRLEGRIETRAQQLEALILKESVSNRAAFSALERQQQYSGKTPALSLDDLTITRSQAERMMRDCFDQRARGMFGVAGAALTEEDIKGLADGMVFGVQLVTELDLFGGLFTEAQIILIYGAMYGCWTF